MDIVDAQRQAIQDIATRYHLTLILLFGSQASGTTHRESDIDLAYAAEHPLDFASERQINDELGDVFHTDKIDIVNIAHASPLLLFQISENCRLLAGTKEDLIRFRVLAWKKYQDTAKLRRMREKALASQYAK